MRFEYLALLSALCSASAFANSSDCLDSAKTAYVAGDQQFGQAKQGVCNNACYKAAGATPGQTGSDIASFCSGPYKGDTLTTTQLDRFIATMKARQANLQFPPLPSDVTQSQAVQLTQANYIAAAKRLCSEGSQFLTSFKGPINSPKAIQDDFNGVSKALQANRASASKSCSAADFQGLQAAFKTLQAAAKTRAQALTGQPNGASGALCLNQEAASYAGTFNFCSLSPVSPPTSK